MEARARATSVNVLMVGLVPIARKRVSSRKIKGAWLGFTDSRVAYRAHTPPGNPGKSWIFIL